MGCEKSQKTLWWSSCGFWKNWCHTLTYQRALLVSLTYNFFLSHIWVASTHDAGEGLLVTGAKPERGCATGVKPEKGRAAGAELERAASAGSRVAGDKPEMAVRCRGRTTRVVHHLDRASEGPPEPRKGCRRSTEGRTRGEGARLPPLSRGEEGARHQPPHRRGEGAHQSSAAVDGRGLATPLAEAGCAGRRGSCACALGGHDGAPVRAGAGRRGSPARSSLETKVPPKRSSFFPVFTVANLSFPVFTVAVLSPFSFPVAFFFTF